MSVCECEKKENRNNVKLLFEMQNLLLCISAKLSFHVNKGTLMVFWNDKGNYKIILRMTTEVEKCVAISLEVTTTDDLQ